jgi:predicted dehydrogenase
VKNVLVIGVGPHTRRTHLPALAAGQDRGLVGTISGVDIRGACASAVDYGADNGAMRHRRVIPVTLVDRFDPTRRVLPRQVRHTLDALVRDRRIDAVVVATEPAVHLAYTRWALERGLSVLLDKPVHVRTGCSVDPGQARAVLTDVDELLERYRQIRQRDPRVLVSVLCQRRYHPAFWRMRDAIAEVTAQTGCPVTSVQSFHSDGQWRLPDELLDLTYHGYDQGYGKLAHSGYHFLDIVPWLLAAGETDDTRPDSVAVHATVARPGDVLAQLGVADHERIVPGFAARNRYTETDLRAATHRFGEVDAFLSLAFKRGGRTLTLGSVNLLHTGFSQRSTLSPEHSDLYKGNGRVRHETHILQQGPLQAVHFHCLQTLDGTTDTDSHMPGGARHVEIHVFRNSQIHPNWQTYTRYDADALTTTTAAGVTEPTQKSARAHAIKEFLDYLNGRRHREDMLSDLTSHRRSVTLMAGAYLSMAQQAVGGLPVATMDLPAVDFLAGHRLAPVPRSDRAEAAR